MWWPWIAGGMVVWTSVAFGLAVVVGRGIRMADQRSTAADHDLMSTSASMPSLPQPSTARVARRGRRRAVPLPAFGIALVAMAVALETAGYVVRLTGARGPSAQLLSMDAPFSLPRMFVAFLFAAAALAAVAGAGRAPGRRTWWLAVGAVAGGIAAVKAGSTVHADALRVLDQAFGEGAALLLSGLAAATILGALWVLSRRERRDRRRVLGVLALYAAASVGLSAVSSLASDVYGGASRWAIAATFLEETGEALAAVAFLMAVLVGVAPRVALPARWALRRQADAHGLELPERLTAAAAAAEGAPAR